VEGGREKLFEVPDDTESKLSCLLRARLQRSPLAKTVRVHDDTHRALKRLKAQRRSRSIDEVIREMIRTSTGVRVGEREAEGETKLISYLKP
jgi:predicted CopG family antitoxin